VAEERVGGVAEGGAPKVSDNDTAQVCSAASKGGGEKGEGEGGGERKRAARTAY